MLKRSSNPRRKEARYLTPFLPGVRTFSSITDRLISGATFGLSDVAGKAVESGWIGVISGKDIDISRGYQPSETVKAVGDVADIGGDSYWRGVIEGIKPIAAPVLSKVATSITQFVKGIHPAVKAVAGIGAGATAFETTRGAIDPDYTDRRDTFSKFGAGPCALNWSVVGLPDR